MAQAIKLSTCLCHSTQAVVAEMFNAHTENPPVQEMCDMVVVLGFSHQATLLQL